MTSPWPAAGTPLDQIATPMPVVDEDRKPVGIVTETDMLRLLARLLKEHR